MVVLFKFEIGYIFIQAARGEQSHFNLSTPFYSSMYSLMAAAAFGISAWTGIICWEFFNLRTEDTVISEEMLWAIRFGLFIFVIFSLQGFAMGSRDLPTLSASFLRAV
jgi:hypothetical protein